MAVSIEAEKGSSRVWLDRCISVAVVLTIFFIGDALVLSDLNTESEGTVSDVIPSSEQELAAVVSPMDTVERVFIPVEDSAGVLWEQTELKCILLFVKVPKCASSCVGGVARRIAAEHHKAWNYTGMQAEIQYMYRNIATRPPRECAVMANHYPRPRTMTWLKEYEKKDKVNRISFIRRPMARALSSYYHFEVSEGASDSDNAVIRYISSFGDPKRLHSSFMTRWLESDHHRIGKSNYINGLLKEYDFIGMVERIDESLVMLKWILGLEFSDILFLKSKGDDFKERYHIPVAKKTPRVVKEMNSKSKQEFLDNQLYKAVNTSLTNTIKLIGPIFYDELRVYKKLQAELKDFCKDKVVWPYWSRTRVHPVLHRTSKQDCYWKDNGCGKYCMKEFKNSDIYKNITSGLYNNS